MGNGIAIVNEDFFVLLLDPNGGVNKEDYDIGVTQYKGETLEVWKKRGDGFYFVYCNRLEIGYWCIPSNLTIN